jgi:cobalt transporter subunit CbtB
MCYIQLPVGQPRRVEMANTTAAVVQTTERSEALRAAGIALILGLGLVFLTGFAYPEVIHNAAHDTRHSLSFPCH